MRELNSEVRNFHKLVDLRYGKAKVEDVFMKVRIRPKFSYLDDWNALEKMVSGMDAGDTAIFDALMEGKPVELWVSLQENERAPIFGWLFRNEDAYHEARNRTREQLGTHGAFYVIVEKKNHVGKNQE